MEGEKRRMLISQICQREKKCCFEGEEEEALFLFPFLLLRTLTVASWRDLDCVCESMKKKVDELIRETGVSEEVESIAEFVPAKELSSLATCCASVILLTDGPGRRGQQ